MTTKLNSADIKGKGPLIPQAPTQPSSKNPLNSRSRKETGTEEGVRAGEHKITAQ